MVDSAGIRIVTWDLTTAEAPVHRLVGDPDLQIGVVEGDEEYSFSRIVDLTVLPDDRLVVSDADAPGLRLFDRNGDFVRTLGARGEGPGEFAAAPSIAGYSGDTLHAWDSRTGRRTAFTTGGDVLESVGLTSGGGYRIRALALRDDGDFLATSAWVAPGAQGELYDFRLEVDSVVVERVSMVGEVLDTFAVSADRARIRTVRDGGNGALRVLQADPPYRPRRILEVGAGHTVVAWSGDFEFDLRTGADPALRVRVAGLDHPADAADIRAHIEAELREDFGDDPIDDMTRTLYLDHLPDRLPDLHDVVVSAEGEIWVARSELHDRAGYSWLVFTPTGDLRGSVRTPPGLRLLSVQPMYVVGVVRDDFDVPFLQRLPLVSPEE